MKRFQGVPNKVVTAPPTKEAKKEEPKKQQFIKNNIKQVRQIETQLQGALLESK